MRIWPAIDLRGGKCVRLRQGDYQRETVFGDDPVAMARRWVGEGADCLHLVDLDAARGGNDINHAAIRAIVQAVDVPCELGGGIRDLAAIERFLGIGVDRLVVGSRALRDGEWFSQMCRQFPHKLALGIDARDGRVATDGWLETSDVSAVDLARRYLNEPLAAIIYTDIATDGMLTGPNLPAMAEMLAAIGCMPLVASGGVTSAVDVAALAESGVAGCIIGRALYEGVLTLRDALAAAQKKP